MWRCSFEVCVGMATSVCMLLCLYISVCVFVFVCFVFPCFYVFVFVFLCVCLCSFLSLCLCVCVSVLSFMFVCLCFCVFVCSFVGLCLCFVWFCLCFCVCVLCVCVSHSVPKSFTLSFHDRLDAVETSRGLKYDSEVSNQRRRFWNHSDMILGRWNHVPAPIHETWWSTNVWIPRGFLVWTSCLVPPHQIETSYCSSNHCSQLFLTWLNQLIFLVLYRYYSWQSINFSGMLFPYA